ncbi:PepSY domain-containing protein [Rhizobium sp. AG855]|uniref:PepSY domain-containing protein n=1 Tax=Rhizobium sp. AG855 TaxID=2183898 RepID=UPI000E76EBB9|nr:PepSY domain-containing protein [Rhizobium sp. AG855]RKE79252.1 YpeB-like protein with putative protease inhibitory function [Rhizobium sp. AG855]
MRHLLVTLCFLAGAGDVVDAAEGCEIPLSEWRPREALKAQLEGHGWTVRSIKAEDGCYEAAATDGTGRRVIAHFDPHSFRAIEVKSGD